MIPVLRVVMPTLSRLETELQNEIVRGTNSDYITDDPRGNKTVPAGALYAARMDANGKITVVKGRDIGLTPDHTFAGWPIPA